MEGCGVSKIGEGALSSKTEVGGSFGAQRLYRIPSLKC